MYNLRKFFTIDRDVVFLNHGSFGATPKPVFEEYQRWQRKLEKQPVKFMGRDFDGLMNTARASLAAEVGSDVNDLVFVPNATHGVNIAARSISLAPGDEILATDQEYGACEFGWDAVCKMSGALYVRQPISLPAGTPEQMAKQFLKGVTKKTRVIFLSHITSPTAIRFPVQEICAVARKKGIVTVVDGAHAYGQIPLDMKAIDADFYTSNCHKWALSPKGAAFLYVNPAWQGKIDPVIVSWGYGVQDLSQSGSRFVDLLQWVGTKDPSAYLSVPAAIRFREYHDWPKVQRRSKEILDMAISRFTARDGYTNAYDDANNYTQLASIFIPQGFDVPQLKTFLYDQHKVELPVLEWNGRKLIRVSINGYNTERDIDALYNAMLMAEKHFGVKAG